ncbi:MAG: haloacid dehalogenase-like hydrolase [Gemmataceae bacterium]|jgi:phosphoglycolate phosphatase-like HAD superfamily hydrolase|uniref:phosphoglycolate phosphatase n=1 Tax=Thermogemmata fonticola TaxID=2755323 RepID=A0A7V8VF66_9BACT|nr:HAD family hydrolase [Thermogemmata fonticola]MBA2226841.1 HAD family hydrolase [Thermogemmata fonticola]MCX8138522.1 haloacid dehalogenase-like hydrolase [Gemmataceae bacterium]
MTFPPTSSPSSFHPPERLEQLRQALRRGKYQAALFDFDGTLSRLRAGWPQVMVQVLEEYWQAAGLPKDEPEQTRQQLLHLVLSTNGMPPLRQMHVFVQMVQERGGSELDPSECAATYQYRLRQLVQRRYDSLRRGETAPPQWIVPGAREMLAALQRRGLRLFLASGTEYDQVRAEADLLGLRPFFPHGIFAPQGEDLSFAKGQIIDHLLRNHDLRGEELIGFGDGVVETREVKRVGGTAIGLATSEVSEIATPTLPSSTPATMTALAASDDPTVSDKCQRLLAAGADLILSDYLALSLD